MKIVKLTFNYDFPIFRQTPNNSQIWGDYKFIIDDNLKECDYWVVFSDYLLKVEKTLCNKNGFYFILGEAYDTSPKFGQKFLDQFSHIITVQREITHKNVIHKQNGLPWFINSSYSELKEEQIKPKSKLLSVVCSNKTTTAGHRKRLEFVLKLKEYFGSSLDVYGKGFNEIDDKREALLDYKYSIAIENDFCLDYVTEKFFDCLYSNTLTFYYGCPNLEEYVDESTFIRININNFKESIQTIEDTISKEEYEKRKQLINKEKKRSLDSHQFFPAITSLLDQNKSSNNKQIVTLNPNIYLRYSDFKFKINKLKKSFFNFFNFKK